MVKIFLRITDADLYIQGEDLVRAIHFEKVTSGWVVSLKDAQYFNGEDGMQLAFEIALRTTNAVGCWRDKDLNLWDVVMIFDNEEDATNAGIANLQKAIYQIETGRLKWLD